jgi:hypothetical protein
LRKPGSCPKLDADRDGNPDLLALDLEGALYLFRGDGRGGFLGDPIRAGTFPDAFLVAAIHDMDDDGIPDLLVVRVGGNDFLTDLHKGRANGTYSDAGTPVGREWLYRNITGAGDFDGDGFADVVTWSGARGMPHGQIHLARKQGPGKGFDEYPDYIGFNYLDYDSFLAPGDLDGDGAADLLMRDNSGKLVLLRGDGHGKLVDPGRGERRGENLVLPGSWSAYDMLVAAGDVTGDGKPDLFTRRPEGILSLWASKGNGATTRFEYVGDVARKSWDAFRIIVGAF